MKISAAALNSFVVCHKRDQGGIKNEAVRQACRWLANCNQTLFFESGKNFLGGKKAVRRCHAGLPDGLFSYQKSQF
jgi:hypothetical protein